MNKYSHGGGQKLNSPNRKKVLLMGLVSLFVIAIISLGTYAIFNTDILTGDNTIKTGQIKMSYTETNEITMDNALPMKDEEGKVLTNYFDFQVLSYIKTKDSDSTKRKINYNIVLEPITVENPLNDSEIKVYLTMIENGVETVVVEPTTIDQINNYILNNHEDIFSNNKGEVVTSYRLRSWIDSKVDPAKFNEKKYNYKFRVNVNSGVIEKTVKDELAFIDEPDTSGANAPKLTSNMIPVYYDMKTDVWRKADASNDRSNWYNYDKKKWANAVTISNFGTYKSTLTKTDNGEPFYSEVGSYYETTQSSVSVSQNYKNGTTYYYSCCSTSRPTLDTSKSYYTISGTWTKNDLLSGKYCALSTSTTSSGSCSYSSSKINYMSTKNFSTTSGNYSGYNWTTTQYSPTPIYKPVNNKISSTYSFNATTGEYTLTNPIAATYSSSYVNYYMCDDKVSTTCRTIYKIKQVDDTNKRIQKEDVYTAEQILSKATPDYEVGDEIPMDKISTMWVWIPRYTYTYFNSSTPQEIKIKFESGTNTSGTVRCVDSTSASSTTSETCTDSTNGSLKAGTSTYTHPAFNFGGTQLTGIWVGKFENSASLEVDLWNVKYDNDTTILIKPDVKSLEFKSISGFFKDIRQMEKANNPYGFPQNSSTTFNWNGNLTGDTNSIDTHLIKNMEWGATAYLSHSKYGINKEINSNNSNYTYTGRSGGAVGGSAAANKEYPDQKGTGASNYYGFYTYDGYLLNYNTNTKSTTRNMSKVASTTGNIYGIYDMSGGNLDLVMGAQINASNKLITRSTDWTETSTPLAKYYDRYAYGTSDTEYTRGKLGDATKEMNPSNNKSWYEDSAVFVDDYLAWFGRGDNDMSNKANLGIFSFLRSNVDGERTSNSSRTVLTIQ